MVNKYVYFERRIKRNSLLEKKSFERFMNPKKMNFYLLGKLQTHQLMSLLFFEKKQTSFVLKKKGFFFFYEHSKTVRKRKNTSFFCDFSRIPFCFYGFCQSHARSSPFAFVHFALRMKRVDEVMQCLDLGKKVRKNSPLSRDFRSFSHTMCKHVVFAKYEGQSCP